MPSSVKLCKTVNIEISNYNRPKGYVTNEVRKFRKL